MIAFNAIHAEINWTLSDDGTLTISGTDMPDYNWDDAPWHSKRDLIKKVVIEKGVTRIGNLAFRCSYLTSITIPNSVTSIGQQAFESCWYLTSITIPKSVTYIGRSAFFGCSNLTSATMPNSVTSIEENTFEGCSGLTSITIPNSVKSIGEGAFYGCKSLKSITIPSSIKKIGNKAFTGCYNLKTIINLSIAPQKINIITFSLYGTLHVLPGCKAKYEAADYWKNFTIVEDATTGINVVEDSSTISADKIFSISGQQLDKTKKGVNIINGKKILVK